MKFNPDFFCAPTEQKELPERREICKRLKHRAKLRRRIREAIYADLGMKKVKGNLGGTYYE